MWLVAAFCIVFGLLLFFAVKVWHRRIGKASLSRLLLGKDAKEPMLLVPALSRVLKDAPVVPLLVPSPGRLTKARMTGKERIDAAMTFARLDRVPVAPFLLHHVAPTTGLTVQEFLFDFSKARVASRAAYYIYGRPDMVTWFPGAGYLLFGGERLLFGTDWVLGDNCIAQIIEKKQWEPEDYDRLIHEGMSKTMIRRPKEGYLQFLRAAYHIRKEIRYVEQVCKAAGWVGAVTVFPFEILSWKRSLAEFITDIFRRPDKIVEASDFMVDGLVAVAKLQASFTGLKRVFFDCNRASATFISPETFKRLVLPSLKRMVHQFIRDGFEILFHLDTDWVPMLPFFRELPPGRYIVELEHTDIRKAKEILYGHMCVKGNVSSTLLVLGTPQEVEAECRRLIDDLAPGGGFILASGCEVPLEAPLENVKALVRAAEKYGYY